LFARQFQEREREYKAMVEVKQPEAIEFLEKEKDTAITNMEELIRQHKQEREKELQQYHPNFNGQPAGSIPVLESVSKQDESPKQESKNEIEKMKDLIVDLSNKYDLLKKELEEIRQMYNK
jgi:hypothetical protein